MPSGPEPSLRLGVAGPTGADDPITIAVVGEAGGGGVAIGAGVRGVTDWLTGPAVAAPGWFTAPALLPMADDRGIAAIADGPAEFTEADSRGWESAICSTANVMVAAPTSPRRIFFTAGPKGTSFTVLLDGTAAAEEAGLTEIERIFSPLEPPAW